ncbi:hypothetical protein ACFSQ3_13030 [Sphingobacterium corticis]|uniref:Uncharacterized protein n=1 Tax=Sphingobacterium corticis TaxID=1812823 RepID=A0ABW5NL80_9SPHI
MNNLTKIEVSKLDITHPYRIVCPEINLTPQRFSNHTEADKALMEAKNDRKQAILSKVDKRTGRTTIIGYSAPITWSLKKS